MTFEELQQQAEELNEIWGYNNTAREPDYFKLVNQSYRDMCWSADAIRGPQQTFNTVANQAEYDLTAVITGNTRDWKTILDILVDSNGVRPTDEAMLRRWNTVWLTAAPGLPSYYYMVRPNTVRFFVTPGSVMSVVLYGIQAPEPLVNPTDTPVIPLVYHEGIAVRAAYLHAKKYAKGVDGLKHIDGARDEYEAYLTRFKQELAEQSGMDGWRYVTPVESDRVIL